MAQQLESSMVCIKYLILISNCIFALTGILLISVGAAVNGVFSNFSLLLDAGTMSPASFLIAIGAIILVVSIFGVFGAAKESTCLINMYTICLIIIFIFEISASFAGLALQGTIEQGLRNNMYNAIQNNYVNSTDGMNDTIDLIQSNLECCGANGPEDWKSVQLLDNITEDFYQEDEHDILVPSSCCGKISEDNSVAFCPEEEQYDEGCIKTLGVIAKNGAVIITMSGITVAIIQAMAIYFSNTLAKSIRQTKSVRALRQMEIRNQLTSSYQPMTKTDEHVITPVVYLTDVEHQMDTRA